MADRSRSSLLRSRTDEPKPVSRYAASSAPDSGSPRGHPILSAGGGLSSTLPHRPGSGPDRGASAGPPRSQPSDCCPPGKAPTKPLCDRRCVFCPIAQDPQKGRTHPVDLPDNLSHLKEEFMALSPMNPVTRGHILVVPRKCQPYLTSDPELFAATSGAAAQIANELYPNQDLLVCTNRGLLATQSVPHIHVHIIPRREGDGLIMPWTAQKDGHYVAFESEALDPWDRSEEEGWWFTKEGQKRFKKGEVAARKKSAEDTARQLKGEQKMNADWDAHVKRQKATEQGPVAQPRRR